MKITSLRAAELALQRAAIAWSTSAPGDDAQRELLLASALQYTNAALAAKRAKSWPGDTRPLWRRVLEARGRQKKGGGMNLHEQVLEFHEAFDQPIVKVPTVPSDERVRLRLRLIAEEFFELLEASIGDSVAAEVHRSNMAKLGPDGRPMKRADGKVVKPEGWRPPDIERVLREQSVRG